MTLPEINSTYSFEDIARIGGNADLRCKLFAPILTNIYENKIVYYERFMCIAIIEDIKITAESFSATAIPYLKIERAGSRLPFYPNKPWAFGAHWSVMRLLGDHFGGYCSWLIWTDKELVKTVEELARKREFETALELTIYNGK